MLAVLSVLSVCVCALNKSLLLINFNLFQGRKVSIQLLATGHYYLRLVIIIIIM